ncbi:MAG: histone deacetylase [Alloalcanivorax venustensis]|jgi:acetoin utilization deacetylase AcuC-like enzyme|uniref:histone deacetylase family protein n=1 Tax=Alloalcanivorax venustensis TaxID=172371 RepID=UPI000C99744E|nr:histone deacetylase [Alcanivorax sp.]MAD71601.1 histone deacetylase [Alcanivorax sp.]MCH2551012.1 histone deacetylase [Alcanivorax sp.]MTI53101.1 histone deacetylase [Alcanivorax sp.]HAB08634.1 histone deacetylase [Alcanivorax sp.]|tara:strand:+ start:49215 stop:50123 length:909 start_codon:yes stop_codon:yes gene_type:complete
MSVPLVYHPSYSFPFPGRHRFPMEKFRLLHERLRDGGVAGAANLHRPGRARPALLSLAHCPEYLDRFLGNRLGEREAKRMGLPWSEDLVRRTCIAPMGTLLTAQLALKHGIACHLAGGTHHAHYDFGSGFCILNDLAITARALRAGGLVKRVLIFDCDVHQGDGTAAILAGDPELFTCSIHCEKNFPTRKSRSDLDVGLPVGLEDDGYLAVVEETLADLLRQLQPDLVLYDAGVDVYAGDPLGRLAVSLTGLAERERRVLTLCREHGVPVATVIGGGYDDDRPALARRHALVVEAAHQLWRQ